MNPTETLSNEHRVIEQVLDCLEEMARRCKTDGQLDTRDANDAIDFFRNFADSFHHAKEENHLFPAMEAKGFPQEGGPTGVMLYEHEQGRERIRAIAEAVDGAAAGDAGAVESFVSNARGYVDLLREHIKKEDECLFSMANQSFSATDQQQLSEAFAKTDEAPAKAGVRERYVKLAKDLAGRYRTVQAGA